MGSRQIHDDDDLELVCTLSKLVERLSHQLACRLPTFNRICSRRSDGVIQVELLHHECYQAVDRGNLADNRPFWTCRPEAASVQALR